VYADPAAESTPRHAIRGAAPTAALSLSPYQPSWPARFRVEAEVLKVALIGVTSTIEHCGSTAVPGLAARPVVDLLLGLPLPQLIDSLASRLANFGYLLASPSPNPRSPRALTRQVRGLTTHRVQVVETHGDDWHRVLLFRDQLREDAALARLYAKVRLDLLQQHPGDALAYANGKASFINSIVGRA
jgi:GrpB-like predicted nucleotidyltransferase (UPF0157 family)